MLKRAAFALIASGALLAACGPKAPQPTVHASMTEVIAPQAQTIWDITNRAYNDTGDGLDPAKISASDWTQLQQAGRQIRERALLMAKEKKLVAAAPGVKAVTITTRAPSAFAIDAACATARSAVGDPSVPTTMLA